MRGQRIHYRSRGGTRSVRALPGCAVPAKLPLRIRFARAGLRSELSFDFRHTRAMINVATARWLLLSSLAASEIFASTRMARPDDIGLISQLGEFEKAEGLISGYKLSEENYFLDLTIIPATPLASGEAGSIGRGTCSLGMQELAVNLTHAWTVRAFVPGESAPEFTCEILAIPSPSRRR